ncbi:hypothetical protein B0A49_08963 [Cryomyces minteri]|uniref:Helicase C-terminal domain-containing protein n=1 Tax=Cryomyces minteri TaxID=331657 RepID=A0A4U0WKH9_9PEZI|nr:hypothetical protein B0A49_08963 [Cryomyces minteri]
MAKRTPRKGAVRPVPSDQAVIPDTIRAWIDRLHFQSEEDFKTWRDGELKDLIIEWVIWTKYNVNLILPSSNVFWKHVNDYHNVLSQPPSNFYRLNNIDFAGRVAIRLYAHFTSKDRPTNSVMPTFGPDENEMKTRYWVVHAFLKYLKKEMSGRQSGKRSLHPDRYEAGKLAEYMEAWNWRPDQYVPGSQEYLTQKSIDVPKEVNDAEAGDSGSSKSMGQHSAHNLSSDRSTTSLPPGRQGLPQEHRASEPQSTANDQEPDSNRPEVQHRVRLRNVDSPPILGPGGPVWEHPDINQLPTFVLLHQWIHNTCQLDVESRVVDFLSEVVVDQPDEGTGLPVSRPASRIAGQADWDLARTRYTTMEDGIKYTILEFDTEVTTPAGNQYHIRGHRLSPDLVLKEITDGVAEEGTTTADTGRFVERTPDETMCLLDIVESCVQRDERVNNPPNRVTGKKQETETLDMLRKLSRLSGSRMESSIGEVVDAEPTRTKSQPKASPFQAIESTFRTMVNLMDNKQLQIIDVAAARAVLSEVLETHSDDSIVYRLPRPMGLSPEQINSLDFDGQIARGVPHRPHQVLFLAWALNMEATFGGGIVGDAPGLGKTHEYMSLIIAGNQLAELDDEAAGATLIVVPHSLRTQIAVEVRKGLGAAYTVHEVIRAQDDLKPNKLAIQNAQFHVWVVTYQQLSYIASKTKDLTPYKDMFYRVILDEAQAIRRFNHTFNGTFLAALNCKQHHDSIYIDEDGKERRCGAYVDSDGVEHDLPDQLVFTQDLVQPADVQILHDAFVQQIHDDNRNKTAQLDQKMHTRSSDVKIEDEIADEDDLSRVGTHRMRMLLAFNVALYAVRDADTSTLREWGNMPLVEYIRTLKKFGGYPAVFKDLPCTSNEELLRQAVWPSVTLRDLLRFIRRVCYSKDTDKPEGKRKVIVFAKWFATLDNIDTILQFLGIRTVKMTASMTPEQRYDIINKFNFEHQYGAPLVFLAGYNHATAGFNLHHSCCSIYHAESGDNYPMEIQAAGRARRIGQTAEQEVVRRMVENTYCEEHDARLLNKYAPFIEAMGAVKKANEVYDAKVTAKQLAMVAMGMWRPRSQVQSESGLFKSYALQMRKSPVKLRDKPERSRSSIESDWEDWVADFFDGEEMDVPPEFRYK